MLGSSHTSEQIVVKEAIASQSTPIMLYGAGSTQIGTVAVHESNHLLFVAEKYTNTDRLVQYDLSSGQALKQYQREEFNYLMSSVISENTFFIGGYFHGEPVIVNSVTRKIAHRPVDTAVKIMLDLETINLVESQPNRKTILIVVEYDTIYSAGETDMFDLTEFVKYTVGQNSN